MQKTRPLHSFLMQGTGYDFRGTTLISLGFRLTRVDTEKRFDTISVVFRYLLPVTGDLRSSLLRLSPVRSNAPGCSSIPSACQAFTIPGSLIVGSWTYSPAQRTSHIKMSFIIQSSDYKCKVFFLCTIMDSPNGGWHRLILSHRRLKWQNSGFPIQ